MWQIGIFVLGTQWNSSAQVQSGTRPDVQNDPLVQNKPLEELLEDEPDELLELEVEVVQIRSWKLVPVPPLL